RRRRRGPGHRGGRSRGGARAPLALAHRQARRRHAQARRPARFGDGVRRAARPDALHGGGHRRRARRRPNRRPPPPPPPVPPPHLGGTAMIGGLAAVLLLFRFPVAHAPVAAPPPALPRLVVDRDQLEPERELARELKREALESGDEDLKSFADEMKKLFDQLD